MKIWIWCTLVSAWCGLSWQLNFEEALKADVFDDLSIYDHDKVYRMKYSAGKSYAYKLDPALSNIGSFQPYQNMTVSFEVDPNDRDEQDSADGTWYSFNYELSLVIVKLTRPTSWITQPHSLVRVGVVRDDEDANDTIIAVTQDRPVPDGPMIKVDVHLFRTWVERDQPGLLLPTDPAVKTIDLHLDQWHPDSAIYFVATLHKRMRHTLDQSSAWWDNGCPNYASDFGCAGARDTQLSFHQLCIDEDLACDFLPNCAQEYLPNSDENTKGVCYDWSFAAALKVMIYTLIAVASLLLLIALIRYCYFRFRYGSQQERQQRAVAQRVTDFLSNSLPRRPRNAPPTYEDATKNDNEAFETDEPPPSYPGVVADEGAAATSTSTSGLPGVGPTPSPPPYRSMDPEAVERQRDSSGSAQTCDNRSTDRGVPEAEEPVGQDQAIQDPVALPVTEEPSKTADAEEESSPSSKPDRLSS